MGRTTHDELDELSRQGDPEADAVIEATAAWAEQQGEWGDERAPGHIVGYVAKHLHMPDEAEKAPPVREYLAARPWPAFATEDGPSGLARMDRGQEFFVSYEAEIGSALFCGSLPEGYAAPRGARVLMLTGRLADDTVRRVLETAQMLLHAMTHDGLDREKPGDGYMDVRRIRLMHAAVRYFIEHDPSVPHTEYLPTPTHGWCNGWGTPLNQEDLLGGLLTFTVSVFEVLERLDVDVDEEQLECYLYRWKVIGALLGIREDALPAGLAEARETAALIRLRQYGPSNDGRELAGALIDALAKGMPATMRGLPAAGVRWYIGTDTASMIGVGPSEWSLFLEGPVKAMSSIIHLDERHSRLTQHYMRVLGAAAIRTFMQANRAGDRPPFEIPEELQGPLSAGLNRFRLF